MIRNHLRLVVPCAALAIVSLVLYGPTLLPSGADPAPGAALRDPLGIEIAVPEHSGKRSIAPGKSFPVVIINHGEKARRIWREWCSWGWFQVSFEVRGPDGRTWTVRRKERSWDKNYPDFWTLSAGEPLVLSIDLASESWTSPVPLASLLGQKVEMRAVFAPEDDPESRKNEVWSGKIVSPFRTYSLE